MLKSNDSRKIIRLTIALITILLYTGTGIAQSLLTPQTEKFSLEVEIISPEPNSQVFQDDLSIVISFMPLKNKIDPDKTRMLIGTLDVSKYVDFYEDFLVLTPPRLKSGTQHIQLEFYTPQGELLGTKSFKFEVVTKDEEEITNNFANKNIRGRMFTNFRSQSLQNGAYSESYLYSGVNIKGNHNKLNWNLNLLVTNQEKNSRQPVNQYGIGIFYRPFTNISAKINLGDMFPYYDDLFFMGLRNRGVEIEVRAKFFSLAFLSGKISRSVSEVRDTLALIIRPGIYERTVTGIMPSFHFGNHASLKFYYMHFKDDPKSVESETNPEENTLIGLSQKINADRNRITLNFQAAVSLYNHNISNGDTPYDTLKEVLDLGNSYEKYYDLAKKFITVNEYLVIKAPYALKGNLNLNYLQNSFTIDYRYIQEGFHSFGNPYLLRDVSGFSIFDRIQVIPGKTYLTLQFEKLKTQFQGEYNDPLDIRRMGLNLNYYPGNNYPSLSFGYTNHTRLKDNNSTDELLYGEDNSINQFYINSGYNFLMGNIKNSVNMNFSTYIKADNLNDSGNNSVQTISGAVKTDFSDRSYSRLFFTFNTSDIAEGDTALASTFKTSSFGLQLGHELQDVLMDDFLTLSVQYYYSLRDYNAYEGSQLIGKNNFGIQLSYNMKRKGRVYINYQYSKYAKDINYSDNYILAGYEKRF